MDFEILEGSSIFDASGEIKELEDMFQMESPDDSWSEVTISAFYPTPPPDELPEEFLRDAPAHVLEDYRKYRAELEAEQTTPDQDKRFPFVRVSLIRSEETVIDDMDDVVIPAQEARITFDYPLSVVAISTVKASTPLGITRGDILLAIHDGYVQIYQEEDAASHPSKLEDRGPLKNREHTEGRFGIFGHDIYDLFVESIKFREHDGSFFIEMFIGS